MAAPRNLFLGGGGVLGALLMALPWIDRPEPMRLPPEFGRGSDAWLLLIGVAREVHDVCVAGDLDELRIRVTPDFLLSAKERLRQLGQRLDRRTLAAAGVAGDEVPALGRFGSVSEMPLVLGRSQGNRACLVLDWANPAVDAGYPVRRGLQGLVFEWDGYRFLLDDAVPRALRAGEQRDVIAEELAFRLLAES